MKDDLLANDECPDIVEGKPCLRARHPSPIKQQFPIHSQTRTYEWLLDCLANCQSSQKLQINILPVCLRKDNHVMMLLRGKFERMAHNTMLYNTIIKQKLSYYHSKNRHPAQPTDLQLALFKSELDKRVNTFKNRFMVYCTDPRSFKDLPFESMAVEITEKQGAVYTMNSTQFTWLSNYSFKYPRWKRISMVKVLPLFGEWLQYRYIRSECCKKQAYKKLEADLLSEYHSDDPHTVELLSWRVAMLVQWESRLDVIAATFIWVKDREGDHFLHDAKQIEVREVPKYKAFEELVRRNELALNMDRSFDTSKLDQKAIEKKKAKLSKYHELIKSSVGHFQIRIPNYSLEENAQSWDKIRPDCSLQFYDMLKLPARKIQALLRKDLKPHLKLNNLPGSKLRKKTIDYNYKSDISSILQSSPRSNGRASTRLRIRTEGM